MRKLEDIKKIIIHCSDSEFGDIDLIDSWHKQRGFLGCGYHYIILNGCPTHGKSYNPKLDGVMQPGRQLREVGAHCKNHNHDSIGICLIGKCHFTAIQLYQSLPDLIVTLMDLPGITADSIFGHRDFDTQKTCPNFDVGLLRGFLAIEGARRERLKKQGSGSRV